jgi:hypothetical protein
MPADAAGRPGRSSPGAADQRDAGRGTAGAVRGVPGAVPGDLGLLGLSPGRGRHRRGLRRQPPGRGSDRRLVRPGLAERDRAERAGGDRRPGVHRPDPHAGGAPDAAGLVSAERRALRAGRGMAAALPVTADGGPHRRGGRRARLPAAERGTRRGPGRAGVRLVPAVGALRQMAWHRLSLAPRRRQARAPARRRRRGAQLAGTRERPGRRLRGAPGHPARTGAAGARVRGDSLLRPALPRGGRGGAAGTPGRHHRPRCRTAATDGGFDRAVGRRHGRLVQPRSPGGLANGLPGLGRGISRLGGPSRRGGDAAGRRSCGSQ